jgi:hypothetical protein
MPDFDQIKQGEQGARTGASGSTRSDEGASRVRFAADSLEITARTTEVGEFRKTPRLLAVSRQPRLNSGNAEEYP